MIQRQMRHDGITVVVVVENVHLSESLMRLSYRVCSMQDERERKAKEKAEQTGTNETC